MNPHEVTKRFENALCEYTGAPFAVAVNSCTMALLLAVGWHLRVKRENLGPGAYRYFYPALGRDCEVRQPEIEIPKRTYVSVPMSIIHAGGRPTFRDEEWRGMYQLKPLTIWDCARCFTCGMWSKAAEKQEIFSPMWSDAPFRPVEANLFQCVSFHASKILGDTQGGAILHDNAEADAWLRRARFDGRTEGVAPKDDTFDTLGYHCYLSPDVAARLLWKLSVLPKHNEPLPNDEYSDLSKAPLFQ